MRRGSVYIIGAGPGDPKLMTLRGLECLQAAEVVFYDRLVDPRILSLVLPGTELVPVGKRPHGRSTPQDAINEQIVMAARQGRTVARLKGGDPFVFGRGAEEAAALRAAGIDFEVVPGISSALAVPAYAGIPLTCRGVSASFTVVSGTRMGGQMHDEDWRCLARQHGTLVILMGLEKLGHIAAQLLAHGMAASTPAAVIEWGTRPYQRTVTAPLGELAVAAGDLDAPSVIVIGEVVALREHLTWFAEGVPAELAKRWTAVASG